jgi:hypothetical protein
MSVLKEVALPSFNGPTEDEILNDFSSGKKSYTDSYEDLKTYHGKTNEEAEEFINQLY